jgi:hypothetical protein
VKTQPRRITGGPCAALPDATHWRLHPPPSGVAFPCVANAFAVATTTTCSVSSSAVATKLNPASFQHILNLNDNVLEVLRLVEIHEALTGKGRGRRRRVEVLNKSGIVLLVACWEAFVEDLASAAFDFLFQKAADHSVFPAKVLARASKDIRTSSDARRVWELAGTGWQQVLQQHRTDVLAEFVRSLNTPKPEQIDGMFEALIGISSLSSAWTWKNVTATAARRRLTALVTLRGDIAHRVTTSKNVKKVDVIRASELIDRLAVASSNHVREFLHQRTGKYPWPAASYGPPSIGGVA